jgi:hypothetical protein
MTDCFILGVALAAAAFLLLLLKDHSKNFEAVLIQFLSAVLPNVARPTRKQLAVVVVILALGAAGGLTVLEMSNTSKFNAARNEADTLIAQAVALERNGKFMDAGACYTNAAELYVPLKQLSSPILGLNEAANKLARDLRKRVAVCEYELRPRQSGRRDARITLDRANQALAEGSLFEARDGFKGVIENRYAEEDVLNEAKAGLDKTQAIIAEFETGKMRLKRPDPVAEFGSIEARDEFKRAFDAKFPRYRARDVGETLVILPNTDNVAVFMDDALVGTVSVGATEAQNSFRYSSGEHRFKFTKEGYTTVEISTADLKSPRYTLVMEKKPVQP